MRRIRRSPLSVILDDSEKRKKYESRKWLNDPVVSGTAFIHVTFEPSYNGKGCFATVKIADCSRNISLDFDADTKNMRRSRLKKLDVIIGELQHLRDLIEKMEVKK
jgi:hypothetical protein